MSDFYIANRLGFNEMSKVVPKAFRLNQSMSNTLRSIAMDLGIQKSQKGKRLEFYRVTEEELKSLTAPSTATLLALKDNIEWRPLLAVDQEVMSKNIETVNAQYPRRMDNATHRKYLADLKAAVATAVVKLNEDKKLARPKKAALGDNPFKVGDLIPYKWDHGAPKEFADQYSCSRVVRVTKSYVELEYLGFKDDKVWANTKNALDMFEGVVSYGHDRQSYGDHGHFIPFKGNEGLFHWVTPKKYNGKSSMIRWDKLTTYKGELRRNNDAEIGYCYSYEARYD